MGAKHRGSSPVCILLVRAVLSAWIAATLPSSPAIWCLFQLTLEKAARPSTLEVAPTPQANPDTRCSPCLHIHYMACHTASELSLYLFASFTRPSSLRTVLGCFHLCFTHK